MDGGIRNIFSSALGCLDMQALVEPEWRGEKRIDDFVWWKQG
jgi:hypothetical protein